MPDEIFAHFLPSLVNPDQLAGGDVVVIDILRASTTIAFALAGGATCVLPCLEIDEARKLAASLEPQPIILGGERQGLPIAGFHCGNSPREYDASTVAGKTVIFTTTNGTRTMAQCRLAERVLVGSFVTFSAVVRELSNSQTAHLLCAGTGGSITREDVLFAGAVIAELTRVDGQTAIAINDQARLARDAWQASFAANRRPTNHELQQQLLQTRGGRNLQRIGLASDVADVAQWDRFDFVPHLDLTSWRITRP